MATDHERRILNRLWRTLQRGRPRGEPSPVSETLAARVGQDGILPLEFLHFKQARGETFLWRRHSCLQRRDSSRRRRVSARGERAVPIPRSRLLECPGKDAATMRKYPGVKTVRGVGNSQQIGMRRDESRRCRQECLRHKSWSALVAGRSSSGELKFPAAASASAEVGQDGILPGRLSAMSADSLSSRQDGILPHPLQARWILASCTFCACWRMGFGRACSGELQFAVRSHRHFPKTPLQAVGVGSRLGPAFRYLRHSRQGPSVTLADACRTRAVARPKFACRSAKSGAVLPRPVPCLT